MTDPSDSDEETTIESIPAGSLSSESFGGPPQNASAGEAAEPIERVSGPFFSGLIWRDRVELDVAKNELTDADNVEEFGSALLDLCNHRHACRVMIDVNKLVYVTSSVLGKFIQMHRTLSREGGRLVLVHPSDPLQEVLEATNLDSLFCIANDRVEGRRLLLDDSKDENE